MNDIDLKKYRTEVSDLAKRLNRLHKAVLSVQAACKRRKQQMRLDCRFKQLLKSKNPQLYREIVDELEKNDH